MANRESVLKSSLENLKSDVELCEKVLKPDRHLLGSLQVNLEVAGNNLFFATSTQGLLYLELERRAVKFLTKSQLPEGVVRK